MNVTELILLLKEIPYPDNTTVLIWQRTWDRERGYNTMDKKNHFDFEEAHNLLYLG